MRRIDNPYPEMIIDESSGIKVSNSAHKIWAEGYEARKKDELAGEKDRWNSYVSKYFMENWMI